MDRFFKAQARDQTGPGKAWLSNAAAALDTKEGRAWILSQPERNAPSDHHHSHRAPGIGEDQHHPTGSVGRARHPPAPGRGHGRVPANAERLIADPKIRIESIGDVPPPYSAPLDTDMFHALERVAGRVLPGVPVALR